MSTEKIFTQITESEKKKNGVVALATRPNMPSTYGEGGLSGKQLQARFDRLASLIIDKYNEMAEALSGTSALEYLHLPEHITNADLPNLSALIEKLVDADGDLVIEAPAEPSIKEKLKELLKELHSTIAGVSSKADENAEDIKEIGDAVKNLPSKVEVSLSETDYKLKVILKDNTGNPVSESEVDFPLESFVVAVRFDKETNQIKFKLRGNEVEEIVVDLDEIFSGVVTSLDDLDDTKALSAATGKLIKEAIAKAVDDEAKARDTALTNESETRSTEDTAIRADVAALKTRLDSLDLPVIQKSLYEHNISIYSYNPAETLPDTDYAVFRCTLYLPFEQTIHFNEIVGAIQTFQGKEFGTDDERVDVLVGSYSGAVTIKNYDGTFTTYPIAEAVVLDDNVWSLQLNCAGGGAYTLRNETATTYDVVRAIADVAESGGGGNAIIECLTLPTENISVTHFYRTPDGKIHWYDGEIWRSTDDTGNAYFVGTLAEYEAQKDTIAVGTLIIITDEGDEESAILGQAILGKMILGKGA